MESGTDVWSWEAVLIRANSLVALACLILCIFASVSILEARAAGPFGENYSLTQSATRVQETNSPGVTFVLNVTKAISVSYSFSWAVHGPAGQVYTTTTTGGGGPSSFTTSVNFPTSFGPTAIVQYVGNYTLNVNQTSPMGTTPTSAGTGQFKVKLTDSDSYQRTYPAIMLAQGYQPNENINITIRTAGGAPVAGYPITRTADGSGALSYTWASIPPSTPFGNYTVTLRGSTTTKTVLDTSPFMITATNVTITQLSITQSSLERSQTENFRFTAVYPSNSLARTGSATVRVIEADGVTEHDVTATYRSLLGQFQGSYQIPLGSSIGAWVASIDIGGFNDGYGNTGPLAGVFHGFAVSPATLLVSVTTNKNNYTSGNVVAITAHVVTPGGANFTSGTVTTTSFYSGREVRNTMQLSYDLTRGDWVGSYTANATDPPGVWLIEVNASDTYGNSGYGSTSALFTVASAPPSSNPSSQSFFQMLTSNFLVLLVIVLIAILGVLGSWIIYRRGRISRRVLKVDLEAVHQEAAKVENDAFFKNVQEQLKDLRKEPPKRDVDS